MRMLALLYKTNIKKASSPHKPQTFCTEHSNDTGPQLQLKASGEVLWSYTDSRRHTSLTQDSALNQKLLGSQAL